MMDAEKAFNQVVSYERGSFPTEAVDYINTNKALFEDSFISVLEDYTHNIELYDLDKDDFIAALLFLMQHESKNAFPAILNLLRTLPYSRERDQPLGDMITEVIPHVLAACFNGNTDFVLDLFSSEETYLFSKVAALDMFEILLCMGKITEEKVLDFYDEFIGELNGQDMHKEFIEYSLGSLAHISLKTLDEICAQNTITMTDEYFKRNIDYIRRKTEEAPYYVRKKEWTMERRTSLMKDGLRILEDWNIPAEEEDSPLDLDELFHEQRYESSLPKLHSVGRNDPCPCGSGKKFKKCCLQ